MQADKQRGSVPHSRWRATLLLLSVPLLTAHCSPSAEVVFRRKGGAELRVPVELALTPESHARGLMYRRDLPDEGGMLFVFPREEKRTFWMKNTPLPLDMIFIGAEFRVVGLVEHAVPFSTKSVGVDEPSRYVLEVHAGFVARHGIQVGDTVELRGIAGTAA